MDVLSPSLGNPYNGHINFNSWGMISPFYGKTTNVLTPQWVIPPYIPSAMNCKGPATYCSKHHEPKKTLAFGIVCPYCYNHGTNRTYVYFPCPLSRTLSVTHMLKCPELWSELGGPGLRHQRGFAHQLLCCMTAKASLKFVHGHESFLGCRDVGENSASRSRCKRCTAPRPEDWTPTEAALERTARPT